MPDPIEQFDTTIEIVTPENIAFRHRVAGPFRRLAAYVIDVLIQVAAAGLGIILLGLVFGTVSLPRTGMGVGLILWFVLNWFYHGLFEAYFNGQTPGKRLMRIRVVSVDGQPIGGVQAVLRNVLRIVDGQPGLHLMLGPFMYQVGLLTAMMNDRYQRLGDLACGTMVVVEQRHWLAGVMRTGEPEAGRMAAAIPADFQVSRSMARALAAYVQRRRNFSWPRRLEIAAYLGEPLRKRFDLPANVNLDLLLCGLYHRTFITDRQDEPELLESPFMQPQPPFAALGPEAAQPIEAIIVGRSGSHEDQ